MTRTQLPTPVEVPEDVVADLDREERVEDEEMLAQLSEGSQPATEDDHGHELGRVQSRSH